MTLATVHETPSPLGNPFRIRARREVKLGPVRVEIRSNETEFLPLRYFPGMAVAPCRTAPDFQLNFCNLQIDAPWPVEQLKSAQDASYRAGRFSAGYYITDHFGAPAHLVTRGTQYWVFGSNFEPILWPYFVKWLLTLYSIEHDMLHLKAASVAIDGVGALLVGRGGSGKTILLGRLCESGAKFLSNTHSLIHERSVYAVPAAMRVRRDALFGPLIRSLDLRPGIKAGEYVADPISDFNWQTDSSAQLRNICLVDYRGAGNRQLHKMDPEILLGYMEQFSLALNVYGLKEDELDHCNADVTLFCRRVGEMRNRLRYTLEHCNTYYFSCDAMDPDALKVIIELLRS